MKEEYYYPIFIVIKNLLKWNGGTCLIFEDDVKFINKSKNNKDNIFNTIIRISTNYDVLFIGYKHISLNSLYKKLLVDNGF